MLVHVPVNMPMLNECQIASCKAALILQSSTNPNVYKKLAAQYVYDIPQVTSAAADRPKPVYKSTACQLGIHKTAGVWPLLDTLLPSGPTSLLVRRWLRRLLLLPPPTDVANSIRTACKLLSGQLPSHLVLFMTLYNTLQICTIPTIQVV